MSTAHVAKFAEIVARDPALLARLGVERVSDEASARICVAKAVNEAKAVGLEFTEEEGYEWMKEEAACASRGELTDTQLEAVAGGKGQSAEQRLAAVNRRNATSSRTGRWERLPTDNQTPFNW